MSMNFRIIFECFHMVFDVGREFPKFLFFFFFNRTLPGGTEVSRILPVDLVLSNFTVPAGVRFHIKIKTERIYDKTVTEFCL